MHHGTCVTHVPWFMSGSLTCGAGENVPGIPGACATRKFTYLGPLILQVNGNSCRCVQVLSWLSLWTEKRIGTYKIYFFNSLRPTDAYLHWEIDHHQFRWWLVAWSVPSHYVNQCWNIVSSNLENKLQWHRHMSYNRHIFLAGDPGDSLIWILHFCKCFVFSTIATTKMPILDNRGWYAAHAVVRWRGCCRTEYLEFPLPTNFTVNTLG